MMDAADLELFERSLQAAAERSSGEALDAALDGIGWHDALADDPRAAVSRLFEVQGAANSTSGALVAAVAYRLGRPGAVVLPALGGWQPPGTVTGDRVSVRGIGMGSLARGETAVVVVPTADGWAAIPVATTDLALRHVGGIDPSLGLVAIGGDVALSDPVPVDWAAAVAMGQLAIGHELIGAARQMLTLARRHAVDRIQFGRPIGAFQAVRHRLADTCVAIEAGAAALDAGWDDASPATAAMAKALAGRAAATAARHCQQVLAGVGFTTEHPLHRYIRRALALDQLMGGSRRLTRQLGDDLINTRQLPAQLPL